MPKTNAKTSVRMRTPFALSSLEIIEAKLASCIISRPIRTFRAWDIKRIYHECEGRIEKPRPDDHRLASRGLPIDDKR